MKSCLKTDSTHIYKVQPPRGKQRRGVHDPSGEGPTGQSAFFTGAPPRGMGDVARPLPGPGLTFTSSALAGSGQCLKELSSEYLISH